LAAEAEEPAIEKRFWRTASAKWIGSRQKIRACAKECCRPASRQASLCYFSSLSEPSSFLPIRRSNAAPFPDNRTSPIHSWQFPPTACIPPHGGNTRECPCLGSVACAGCTSMLAVVPQSANMKATKPGLPPNGGISATLDIVRPHRAQAPVLLVSLSCPLSYGHHYTAFNQLGDLLVPDVRRALRGARNRLRFEASSAWIFRPSYHRQHCALRRRICASAHQYPT